MKKSRLNGEISRQDVTTALRSLRAAFKARFIRTDCNAPDPKWRAPNRKPIDQHVRDQMSAFREELSTVHLHSFHSGVFQRFDSNTLLTVADRTQFTTPRPPRPSDLLHIYGPDRDKTSDWRRYYRYAWTEKGPHAIIYSSNTQIVQEGKLSCNSYSYSGQNSYALAGAGMFFLPEYGNANVSVRPYVQWLTSASFTGNDKAPASARALLGIYVESWALKGGGYSVDRDHWIPVWSQNTQSYMVNTTAGGAATVGDGLSTEFFAAADRKYAIFVYAYLETSAEPQQKRNEVRFVTIDIDASVPFVVVEEKLK